MYIKLQSTNLLYSSLKETLRQYPLMKKSFGMFLQIPEETRRRQHGNVGRDRVIENLDTCIDLEDRNFQH